MVGRPILRAEEALDESITLKEVMCGDEAAAVRASLDCQYPVSNHHSFFVLIKLYVSEKKYLTMCLIKRHSLTVYLCSITCIRVCRLKMALSRTGRIWNICGTTHFITNYRYYIIVE